MSKKVTTLPFNHNQATELLNKFGSPLYVYDEAGIKQTAENLYNAFSWAKNYKNFFAVKATPTPAILKVLHSSGMGFDCSSRTELLMVQKLGISGEDIFFTSNNTSKEDFELAIELGATVNIDDITQVSVFIDALEGSSYQRVALRYNPGDLKHGNAIIGEPTEAKYGMSLEQLASAFRLLANTDIAQFGLHTMVASNELDPLYFGDTAQILLDAVTSVEAESGVKISFINLGGGFGLNYHQDQEAFNMQATAEAIRGVLKNRTDLEIFTENGRAITGAHGYLLTKVTYVMQKYKSYIGVDASMHNLMRPGMYGAYHHITVLGKENDEHEVTADVVGSLCENNDKFAINRRLPRIEAGDIFAIHDAGAHGHAMGFNYNGLLRSAEVLLTGSGAKLIRRAEIPEDYFATIEW